MGTRKHRQVPVHGPGPRHGRAMQAMLRVVNAPRGARLREMYASVAALMRAHRTQKGAR